MLIAWSGVGLLGHTSEHDTGTLLSLLAIISRPKQGR